MEDIITILPYALLSKQMMVEIRLVTNFHPSLCTIQNLQVCILC